MNDIPQKTPEMPATDQNQTQTLPVAQIAAAPSHKANEVWVVSRAAQEAGSDYWKPITDAMTATANLLWPLIAIVAIVFLRKQIVQAAAALATRFADPDQSLKLGPLEVSRRIDALESQVESSRVENQVLVSVAAPVVQRSTEADQGEAMRELRVLAEQYRNVKISDWSERVRAKDAIAARMASLVITAKIPREALARDKDEGVRMALATVITSDPKAGDENCIAVAAPGIGLRHVRYRFMMAIGRLAEFKLLSAARARDFLALATDYRKGADDSLLGRIDRTVQAITPIAA